MAKSTILVCSHRCYRNEIWNGRRRSVYDRDLLNYKIKIVLQGNTRYSISLYVCKIVYGNDIVAGKYKKFRIQSGFYQKSENISLQRSDGYI